jgi:hypothetical protein
MLPHFDPKPVSSLITNAVTCGLASLGPRSDGARLDFLFLFYQEKRKTIPLTYL